MNKRRRNWAWFWRYAAIFAAVVWLGLIISCGAKKSGALGTISPEVAGESETPATPGDGLDLVMLKDASGAPTGVKVYWYRVNESDVIGYFLYRDTEPIAEPDPGLRVNGGEIIHQPDESVTAILFDDLFAAEVGTTYYYRVTAVDYGWDEGPLSMQRSITISSFLIEGFTPIRGPVGARVTITGEYFGEYNDQTDAVYFTGVRNDKGPSALYVDDIQATILSWENTRIVAYVPLGTTIGAITVVSDNTSQETDGDFECTSPYLLSVSPDPATAGQEINFYGANFGPPDGMNKLMINDVAYSGLFSSWSGDHVVADLPVDMPIGLVKLELLIGDEITNPYYCDILPADTPTIQKITPGYGIPDNTVVEVLGYNFGENPDFVTVLFNGVEVSGIDLDYLSDTVINLTIPVGASRIGEVYVVIDDGISSEESNYYLYHTLPETAVDFDDGIIAGRVMGEYSDIVLGPDGEGFAVFTQSNETGGPSSLYLAYEDAGDVAIDELVTTYQECRYPRVALDSTGVVHFAYQTYGWLGQVRYGTWDNGNVTDQLVYQEGSTDNPGAYLDMVVLDDGQGGIDRILVWSNELDEVMCGYMLDGASGWTTDVVHTADGAYNEQVGYYCSLDVVQEPEPPPPGPPPIRAPSALGDTAYLVGVSFGVYSESEGAHWEVRACESDDLDIWAWDVAGYATEQVTETVFRWHQLYAEAFILWSTDSTVYWSYASEGWATEEVTSAGDHYGAALDLDIDESTNNQYAGGNEGQDAIFTASFDYITGEWSSSTESIPGGHRVEHVGRGGAVLDYYYDLLAMSVYDPDMRDIALTGYNAGPAMWQDLADGFATPGYDLSNRAVVCDSSGVPHVVFGDIDPVSGERTLWMARYIDTGGGASPLSPFGNWEYDLIDSATNGTLGHATMAVDEYGTFHIAYLKGDGVMYVDGVLGDFGIPQSVFIGGAVTSAPRITLGLNSALDINIVAAEAGSPWRLWLIESENGMASYNQSLAMSCDSAITQYDVAVRHDGNVVVAAYLDSPENELTIWEERSGLRRGFSDTSGMNAGITLTLDEDMHYCVTLADMEGMGYGYMLHWNGLASDYLLEEFTTGANASLTMSQWRTEQGPFISYLNESSFMGTWSTYGLAYIEGLGSDMQVESFYDEQKVPVLHSVDPFHHFGNMEGVFAYYPDADAYDNLWAVFGPEIG